MRISQVNAEFSARVHELKQQAAAIAAAAGGNAAPPWQLPVDIENLTADGVAAGFPRESLNEQYLRAMQAVGNGVASDCVATKKQIDAVAGMERAVSLQLASPCRLQAFAVARRAGHGQGELFDAMEREVAAYLAAGGAAQ